MKKRERKRKDGNVILFPDLELRLLEKGLEHLQSKRFRQAVECLESAIELDPDNHEIYIGLVLAYFEAGMLEKAKHLAKEMLKEGIGDYIQTVDIYLMILVQLHEYKEIVTTIEVLLEEREIPQEKFEHFSRMLEFSRRMDDHKPESTKQLDEEIIEPEANTKLFYSEDSKEQLLRIAQLSHENIRPYLNEIKDYLMSGQGHPFLKTMLLNVLKEHEYDKEVRVDKFHLSKMLKPIDLFDFHNLPQKQAILAELKIQLENEDPILFEHTQSLVDRQTFLIYPFEFEPVDEKVWAAAFHLTGIGYLGIEKSIDEIVELYETSKEEVINAIDQIKEIEEISYPII